MQVVETLCLEEPQWILDRTGNGHLFWRRDSSETKTRVTFRYDVDVKEFHREAFEMEKENLWIEQGIDFLTTAVSVLLCVTITVILPWFLFAKK